MARAHRRAADCRALTGVPTVPMVGLLATAHLDDELLDALRVLVAEPADLTSTDAFVGPGIRCGRELRQRLLDTLDLFGIARAVLALGEGADAATVPDGAAAGQPCRQGRRAHRGGGRAGALPAAAVGDHRITCSRSAIRRRSTHAISWRPTRPSLAVMAAAVDVVEAAGLTVDRGDDAARTSAPRACTGSATAGVPSTPCTAAAAPTSAGVRCGCSARGAGDARPGGGSERAADALVAGVDPGLSSPGVESRDVVLVTGPVAGGHHRA